MSSRLTSSATKFSRRRLFQFTGLGLAGVTGGTLLQAYGGGNAQESSEAAAEIEMNDAMRFEPETLTVRVGTTVTWRNVGTMVHTATGDPAQAQDAEHAQLPEGVPPWDSGLIRAGDSWSHTFETAGEYTYFCLPHEAGGMIGALTVEA